MKELLIYLTSPRARGVCKALYCEARQFATTSPKQKKKTLVVDTHMVPPTGQETSDGNFGLRTIKTNILFQTVEKLGPWRVMVSSRAHRNLRELRRGDGKMFRIVMKKIKELSDGHFSDDNQKKLTGRDTAVPIFEAKMTRDTRLVVSCFRSDFGCTLTQNTVLY